MTLSPEQRGSQSNNAQPELNSVANRWGIPRAVEELVLLRDRNLLTKQLTSPL